MRAQAKNTLKVQISALPTLTNIPWAKDPLISHFLRAPKWDLPLVLKWLLKSQFYADSASSIYYLTLKFVFLTAVVLARRVSDIVAFSCMKPYCTFLPEGVVLCPSLNFLHKTSFTLIRSQFFQPFHLLHWTQKGQNCTGWTWNPFFRHI